MLRNSLSHGFVRKFHQRPHRVHTRTHPSKFNVRTAVVGAVVGVVAYDGYNEFEVCGGISRFLRSLRIAAQISLDYSWHLYGVAKDSEEFDRVNHFCYSIQNTKAIEFK